MDGEFKRLEESVGYIKKKGLTQPRVGIILGSGLGELAEKVEGALVVPYTDVPHLPASTVPGHKGQFVFGNLNNQAVAVMQGRFHGYEGYKPYELVRPVRVLGLLGIEILIITNAAGAINRNFSPGEFMIITDHINMMGINPLLGGNIDELGPRFPDMSKAYDRELIAVTDRVARSLGKAVHKGVYCGCAGPNFETPAEIRMMERLGADVVGMSTVPEVLASRHMGIRVLGISCITNMAAGILPQPLSHEEVIEVGQRVRRSFRSLIQGVLAEEVIA